jgi:hypothetical protein
MAEMADTNCADCRWNTLALGEWYAVRDDVWEQACRRDPRPAWEILCIGCLEERLGRISSTPRSMTRTCPVRAVASARGWPPS